MSKSFLAKDSTTAEANWFDLGTTIVEYTSGYISGYEETDPVFVAWDKAAHDIVVDAAGFDGNLATTDINVQMALQKLDDLTLSGGSSALVNVETLSAAKTLVPGDKVYQYLDSNNGNRIINIPNAGFAEGAKFVIFNTATLHNFRQLQITLDGPSWDSEHPIVIPLREGGIFKVVHNGTEWMIANEQFSQTDTPYGYYTSAYNYGTAFGARAEGIDGGVAVGYNSIAYANGVAIGNICAGWYGGVAVGYGTNTSSKNYAIALGYYSKCERYNEFSISADGAATNKKARNQVSWYGTTANDTQTEIYLGGTASKRCTVLASSAFIFKIDVTAIKSDGSQGAGYKIEGVIRRDNANNTVFIGTPVVTVLGEDDAAWDVIVEADNINKALVVKVTGVAATIITWHAAGYFTEVRF